MVYDKPYQILRRVWTVSSEGFLRIKIIRVRRALFFLWAALLQRAEETAGRWVGSNL